MKIRDRETVEPPHVTLLRKTQAWRIDLRTGKFMDAEPDPDDVPERSMVEGTLAWLRADLEARRAALTKMLAEPKLTAEEIADWDARLAQVEVILADVSADELGYMAWLLAERHMALRKKTDRFTQ